MTRATDLFAAERVRQIEEEGYDAAHDRGHAAQLVAAGTSYGMFQAVVLRDGHSPEIALALGGPIIPPTWPWSSAHWKPTGDPRRDLVKVGALIAAALDSILEEDDDH
jgi:hypothetical protein